MLIYKYKSLSPLEHVLDVIVNERLFCAEYSELNDPFEGQFQATYYITKSFGAGLLSARDKRIRMRRPKAIKELDLNTQHTRVCSLSMTSTDVRMWSLYANGHKGIAIEIDFSGIEENAKEVVYSTGLAEFGTSLLGGATPEDVLTRKTNHWEYEKEYRIIWKEPYFPITGRIRRVIVGYRAPEDLVNLLRKVAPKTIGFHWATLDQDGVLVHT